MGKKAAPSPAPASWDFWVWGAWRPETLGDSSVFGRYLRGQEWDGMKV